VLRNRGVYLHSAPGSKLPPATNHTNLPSFPISPPFPSFPYFTFPQIFLSRNLARGLGKGCKLRPAAGCPARKRIFTHFRLSKRISWQHFSNLCAMQMTCGQMPAAMCMGAPTGCPSPTSWEFGTALVRGAEPKSGGIISPPAPARLEAPMAVSK